MYSRPYSLWERIAWLSLGFVLGLTGISLSRASAPTQAVNDVAIYQNLRELRMSRMKPLNFDRDVKRLSRLEMRFQERLPGLSGRHARLRAPLKRISRRRYRSTHRRSYKKAYQASKVRRKKAVRRSSPRSS